MITLEERTKWCAALRSGKYEQGHAGFLHYDDRHCCLGVYEVVVNGRTNEEICNVTMPCYLKGPDWIGESAAEILADKNDCYVPFPGIADFIESQPLEWLHA